MRLFGKLPDTCVPGATSYIKISLSRPTYLSNYKVRTDGDHLKAGEFLIIISSWASGEQFSHIPFEYLWDKNWELGSQAGHVLFLLPCTVVNQGVRHVTSQSGYMHDINQGKLPVVKVCEYQKKIFYIVSCFNKVISKMEGLNQSDPPELTTVP